MLIGIDTVRVTSCNWAPTKISGDMFSSSSGINADSWSGEKQPIVGESNTMIVRYAATVRDIVTEEWFGVFHFKGVKNSISRGIKQIGS